VKKKKRPQGRPERPWEYWDDLARYEHMAGHILPGQFRLIANSPTEWSPNILEYFRTLFRRPQKYPRLLGQGLSRACREIIKDGPLRWKRDDKIVAEISDWKTLRVRITEAIQHPRPQPTPPMTTELWQGNKLLRGKQQESDWARFLKEIDRSKAKWGGQVW
jgi:hypothetical protein